MTMLKKHVQIAAIITITLNTLFIAFWVYKITINFDAIFVIFIIVHLLFIAGIVYFLLKLHYNRVIMLISIFVFLFVIFIVLAYIITIVINEYTKSEKLIVVNDTEYYNLQLICHTPILSSKTDPNDNITFELTCQNSFLPLIVRNVQSAKIRTINHQRTLLQIYKKLPSFNQYQSNFYQNINQIENPDILNILSYLILLEPIRKNFLQFVTDIAVAFIRTNKPPYVSFHQYVIPFATTKNYNLSQNINEGLPLIFNTDEYEFDANMFQYIQNWLKYNVMTNKGTQQRLSTFINTMLDKLHHRLSMYEGLMIDIEDKLMLYHETHDVVVQFCQFAYKAQIENLKQIEHTYMQQKISDYKNRGLPFYYDTKPMTHDDCIDFFIWIHSSYMLNLQDFEDYFVEHTEINLQKFIKMLYKFAEEQAINGGSYNIPHL